jgi:steroid delta-isomerase-like uncharacterized protein
MLSHDQMRAVLQEHVDAENAHDRDRVLATYVERDPVFEDVPTGRRFVGADEIVGNYTHLWDGFPGLVRRIDRWTFGDDACTIELTLTGTHDGMYRDIKPTGRKLELRIIAHFTFDAAGRIKQETAYYDALTFMRQLGLTSSTREVGQ